MATVADRDVRMRRLLFLTALFVLLLLGLVLNGLQARRADPPPFPVSPVAGHGQLMANLDLAGLSPAQAARYTGWAADDGNAAVRLRAPWSEIEPEREQYHWETTDAAISGASERGLQVVLLLDGAPGWAVAGGDAGNPLAPPHDVRDFGRFAEAAAQRYGDAVDIYQVWDEPNIAPHWGARWVSAQGYFDLLREAANSIHRADPTASIMLAALAPTTANDGNNVSDLSYLQQLYELGAGRFFDLAAGQAYGFDQPPDAAPAADRLNFRRPELVHGVMARHGDAAKPLWITAWGWWTSADGAGDSPWGGVDPATAADYAQQGALLARMQWPWTGPLGWADYVPTPGRDPRRAGFVLRSAGGDLTSSGLTLAALKSPPSVLGTGSHVLSPITTQEGADTWRFSPDAADPGAPGAELTALFEGRAVAVEVQRGPYWATLNAWIDGAPAPLLPRDETGTAYIALNAPANGVEVVPLARDLAPGRHELRLQASAGWGQWLLRRLIVDHAPWPQPWPFWPLATVLVLATAIVGWQLWTTARSAPGGEAVRAITERWDAWSARAGALRQELAFGLALLLTLALYLAPNFWLTLLLLAAVAALIGLRPELAPPLILSWLPFYIRPKPFGPVGIAPHELLIWLAFGFWLLRQTLTAVGSDRRSSTSTTNSQSLARRALSSLDTPVLLLLFVAAFAALNATRGDVAVYEWRTVFLAPVVFYFLVTRSGQVRGFDLRLLTDGLVVGAVAVSVLALVQAATGRGAAIEGVVRVSGLYGSANNLALYLGRVLPLLIAAAALAARYPRAKVHDAAMHPARDLRRWLYFLALIPVAVAAFLTFSKGLLLISLPVSLILLAVLERRLRLPVLVLAVAGALTVVPFLRTPRFNELLNTQSGTTFFRLQLWQSAWRMWRDHPWLGVGPDNFLYAYRSHYVLPGAWEELNLSHPHNLVLDLLTRLGVFGLAAGAWLLVATFITGWRLLRSQWAPFRPYYLGLYVGLAAGLAHGLTDNSIFLVDLSILTLFVVAVSQRLQEESRTRLEGVAATA